MLRMSHPLDVSRLKVSRADEHLKAIEESIKGFIEKRPYGLGVQADMKANDLVQTIHIREDPPPEFGLVIGDCVHNLASALDYIVCALATKVGADCDRTAFPIYISPTLYSDQGGRRIKNLSDPAKTRIKSFQPFLTDPKAPELAPLAILYDLDRFDKHRVLLVGATVLTAGSTVNIKFPSHAKIIPIQRPKGPLKDGAAFARFRCVGCLPTEVNVEGNVTFSVGFGEGSGEATGDPVLAVLQRLRARVAEVIADFDSLF
jgi:hypothetical protein